MLDGSDRRKGHAGPAADADAAIAVHKYDDTNVVELISRKNRFGPDFCVYLEADFSTGTMREHFNQDILN